MADLLAIDVDTRELLAAIDAVPDTVLVFLRPAAKVTADNIAREAKGRVARRTGVTASMIHVEETLDGTGYVVLPWDRAWEQKLVDSGNNDRLVYALPGWLEFGTRFMSARPYFFASARLEEGAHDRRAREAVQEAIDALGLGDAS